MRTNAGTSAANASGLPKDVSPTARLYLRPVGLGSGRAACGLPLAGGRLAFPACEVIIRDRGLIDRIETPVEKIMAWAEMVGDPVRQRITTLIERLTAMRVDFAERPMTRPLMMGIVNVTPDSFSDGGEFYSPEAAIVHAQELAVAGADILDIGGESTRPTATPVATPDELKRVLPVIEALAATPAGTERPALSIDTRHADVMAAALTAGAVIVNDITALTGDPRSLAVAGAAQAVVLMHMRGEPRTMNENPVYDDVVLDVYDFLEDRVDACVAAGIDRRRLIIDPGIGFGKKGRHNLKILRSLALYHGIGCPLLLGVSRKGLTGAHDREYTPKQRLPGSLAAVLAAFERGAQLFRVHDVAATRQAVAVWEALTRDEG